MPATSVPLDVEPVTKGERTRRRLLELAIERFGERGYRGTSVSEIARSAGVTQAAVYTYFDSKEALFEAAVDADASEIVTRARAQSEGVDVHALIPTLLIAILGMLDEHPLVRRVFAGDEREQLQRLLANLPVLAELTDWLADEVRRAQDEGRVRLDIDPGAYADGAETLLLSLIMSVTQVGASNVQRRQLGVLTIFDRLLRTP